MRGAAQLFVCLGLSLAFIFSCGRSAGSTSQEDEVGYDEVYGDVHLKSVVLKPGGLSHEIAREIGVNFVRTADLNHFSELLVVENGTENRLSTRGTVPANEAEASFDRTLDQIKSITGGHTWAEKPVARVIAFGGAALFSYRPGGRGNPKVSGVEEELLAGDHDPTALRLQEGRIRLLKVAVKNGSQQHFPDIAAFYKVGEAISCSTCERLAQNIRAVTQGREIEVQARRDVWFASLYFPLMFRFEPDDQPVTYTNLADRVVPPSVVQFYRTPETSCRWKIDAFSCQRFGLIESVPSER